jgi:hypothetical protein
MSGSEIANCSDRLSSIPQFQLYSRGAQYLLAKSQIDAEKKLLPYNTAASQHFKIHFERVKPQIERFVCDEKRAQVLFATVPESSINS